MKKTLLTGSDGFIGSTIATQLLKETDDHLICVCSWTRKGEPSRLKNAICGREDRVTVITHDLSVPFTEKQKQDMGDIDRIINVASDSHVDRSIEEPVDFIQNNVNLALTMLELAREKEPELFLQFSTDEVYGAAKKNENHKEWSAIVPSNPYSASKAAQEAIAISYWRTYSVPVVITNTMNVYGAGQDWEKFIPLCVDKILRGETITIHGNAEKTGAGSRSYIHVDQVADAVLFLMRQTPQLYPDHDMPLRVNIVGEEEIDNLALAQRIGSFLNKGVLYEIVDFHSSRPGHDLRYSLDGTKLAEMGWKPQHTLSDKLRDTVLTLADKHMRKTYKPIRNTTAST